MVVSFIAAKHLMRQKTTDDHELVTMFEELDEDMVIANELDYTTDEDTDSDDEER